MTVVIPAETIVRWRKSHATGLMTGGESLFTAAIMKVYTPSPRIHKMGHSQSGRRKSSSASSSTTTGTSVFHLDESLGLKLTSVEDTTLKNIVMALNKLGPDNTEAVLMEIKQCKPSTYKTLQTAANVFYKKAIIETMFRHHYFNMLDSLGDWRQNNEGFNYTIKDLFLIKLQSEYENISKYTKEDGCRLMSLVASIYGRRWVSLTIFDSIIGDLLENHAASTLMCEFALAFLKECPTYPHCNKAANIILSRPALPIRIKMMVKSCLSS
jgi:hypothetical protein